MMVDVVKHCKMHIGCDQQTKHSQLTHMSCHGILCKVHNEGNTCSRRQMQQKSEMTDEQTKFLDRLKRK